MSGLPIAVEITPPDAPREQVAVLMAACGRASEDAECVPAAEISTKGSRALALVTWSGERRVVIEVGVRKEGHPEWRSRTLDFERIDEPLERWRTIGFVVGTLSRSEAPPSEPSKAEAPDASKKVSEPPPSKPVASPRKAAPVASAPKSGAREQTSLENSTPRRSGPPPGATIDVGGVLGPALDGTRGGALVRGRFRMTGVLGAVFAVRYLDLPIGGESFGGRWITGCAGVGVELGSETFLVAAAVDARAEYFQARAEDDYGWREWGGRVLPGVGLGVNAGWMPIRALGVFVGGDGAAMFGTTDVTVKDQPVATDKPLHVGVEAGVRVRLW